jgi:hypothetical protein
MSTEQSMIPKIIHQTWSDQNIPVDLSNLQQTWLEHHPDWEYRFWTDISIREFLAEYYNWFLPFYDGYEHSICRVDSFRYFLLYHYGGIYIDLDFEALRSIDELIVDQDLLVGLEPVAHAKIVNAQMLLSPAWMASTAFHPFWQHVHNCLQNTAGYTTPLDLTGPFFLTRAYLSYPQSKSIVLVNPEQLHPLSREELEQGVLLNINTKETITKSAFAIHHWASTWWKSSPAPINVIDCPLFMFEQGKQMLEATFNYASYKLIDRGVSPQPLVSCLMVTKDRFRLAIRAINCFLHQTYSQKELVIIDDSKGEELQDFVRRLSRSEIKYFRLPSSNATLGDLRNFSVAQATGVYICQWDDDDLCDPLRLDVQISAIQALKVDGCFLDTLYHWWPHQNCLSLSIKRLWECSLLCRKDIFPVYPSLRKGEDTVVLQQIIQGFRLVALHEPRLYLYGIHQRNTWHQEHFDAHWRQAQIRFEGTDYITELQKLAFRMPIYAYLQSMITLKQNDLKA